MKVSSSVTRHWSRMKKRVCAASGAWDQQTVAPLALIGEWLLTWAALTGDPDADEAWHALRHQVSGAMAQAPLGTLDLWRLARLADRGPRVVMLSADADSWFDRAASRTPVDVLWLRPNVASALGRLETAASGTQATICRGSVCAPPCRDLGALIEQLRPQE